MQMVMRTELVMKVGQKMQSETGLPEVPIFWDTWSVDPGDLGKRTRRLFLRRPGGYVRVLPGNPSLPIRVFLGAMARRMNGGVDGSALGIDLDMRGNEVRKLFYAGGFTGVLVREGIDPDEFLQEVYRGILARNRGTCPWDHKKSSFGHYVHIIIRCVLSNYLRRERLRGTRESVTDDGELPAGVGTTNGAAGAVELRDLLSGIYGPQGGDECDRVVAFLSALYAGQTRKMALAQIGMNDAWGARVLNEIRGLLVEGS
jgi:hypothetical protein